MEYERVVGVLSQRGSAESKASTDPRSSFCGSVQVQRIMYGSRRLRKAALYSVRWRSPSMCATSTNETLVGVTRRRRLRWKEIPGGGMKVLAQKAQAQKGRQEGRKPGRRWSTAIIDYKELRTVFSDTSRPSRVGVETPLRKRIAWKMCAYAGSGGARSTHMPPMYWPCQAARTRILSNCPCCKRRR